jgi:hypothetical protein
MTIISKIARVAAPLAFAALFGLAACSKDPAPEEPQNFVENESVGEEIPPEAAPQAPEVVNVAPPANVAVAPPVDTTTRDQQMQEDADASGMTARVHAPEEGIVVADGDKK